MTLIGHNMSDQKIITKTWRVWSERPPGGLCRCTDFAQVCDVFHKIGSSSIYREELSFL